MNTSPTGRILKPQSAPFVNQCLEHTCVSARANFVDWSNLLLGPAVAPNFIVDFVELEKRVMLYAIEDCSNESHQTYNEYSWLHTLIYKLAYPEYDCEDCLGIGRHYGCQCSYYEAIAPGIGPKKWHLFWRWVWEHRA